MFAEKMFMQTCFAGVTHAYFLFLGEFRSTTVVLGITKPQIEDSAGKDLCFCPCLKTSTALLPQQRRQVGACQLDPTAVTGPCSRGLQRQ